MKIKLEYYISVIIDSDELRPSLVFKFAKALDGSKYDYFKGYEFFQLSEGEVRPVFKDLTDEEWSDIMAYFRKCGLHFGMTESDCISYMDAEYVEKHAPAAKATELTAELIRTLKNMSDRELSQAVRNVLCHIPDYCSFD